MGKYTDSQLHTIPCYLKDNGEIWLELAYMFELCISGSSVYTGVTVAWNIVNGQELLFFLPFDEGILVMALLATWGEEVAPVNGFLSLGTDHCQGLGGDVFPLQSLFDVTSPSIFLSLCNPSEAPTVANVGVFFFLSAELRFSTLKRENHRGARPPRSPLGTICPRAKP